MSDEELILEKLRMVRDEKVEGYYLCDKKHSKILLDYIKELQERFNALMEAHKIADELNNIYEDRIDRAIEYIEEYQRKIWLDKNIYIEDYDDLINILKGSDKE